jgi:NAD(P)-dependent dehydrogenase (short-subunit alcohol dehydrogenase family)
MSATGKVAIVTGGGQGLGRGIALALSAAGYWVAILGRTLSKLEATAQLCAGECLPIACDLIYPDQVRAAFATVDEAFGRLDVLVNNAASYAAFDLTEARDEQIVDVVTQSLIAPIYCSREAVIAMRRVRGGDIVNISTQSVQTPQPTMIVYSAAKGGLDVFAQGLRNEFRTENIRVLTVQIGVVANSTLDTADPEGAAKYMAGLQRAGLEKAFVFPGSTPADIAASIVHAVTAPRNTVIEDIVIRGFEGPEG